MESKGDWMRWLYSYRAISTPMTSVRFGPFPPCGLKRDNVIGVEGVRWLYSHRALSTPMTSVRFGPSPLCGLKRDNVKGVQEVWWLYSLRAPPLSPAPSLNSTAVYTNTLP